MFVSLDGGEFNWAIVAFMNAGNVKMCCWPERMVCEASAKQTMSGGGQWKCASDRGIDEHLVNVV